MGFNLNGFVLRPARVATGNSTSTGEATTGVCRDHISAADMTSLGYSIAPGRDVEPYADMYRAAVLDRPTGHTGTEEYIIWAATTGSFSTLNDASFIISGDTSGVTPAQGILVVGAFDDGTDTLFVQDSGGRDLGSPDPVAVLTLVRGDNQVAVVAAFDSQDAPSGRVVLDSATLTSLGGGFSVDRGDRVTAVSYKLANPTFWWTRNDSFATRFGWSGKVGRWMPFQGTVPQDMGSIEDDGGYELTIPPSRFSVGDQLPGDSGTPDGFALIRAGSYPDSSSTPLDVVVVTNADAQGDYPAAGAGFDAVVGVTNGLVLLNPTYVATNSGLTLWYNPESFPPDANGDLGSVANLPTDTAVGFPVLSPTPGPTERPFVRIGFRRPLTPVPVDTDADLVPPSAVTEGSFYWSRSTGKIVLSETDIKKTQPGEAEYDIAYLEAHVFYDGVSLTTQPITVRLPSPALDSSGDDLVGVAAGGSGIPGSGDIYIKKAVPLPPPGVSGVLYVPDGTGEAPDISLGPDARPNGSGLVRQLKGTGDTFLFTGSKAFETLEVEEFDEDLPVLKIKVAKTEIVAARQLSPSQPTSYTDTSRIQLKRRGIRSSSLYFQQADVTPSVYSDDARLYARFAEPYVLDNTELLRFDIDGTTYTWAASALAPPASSSGYTAQEIVDSLNTVITGSGSAVVIRSRVALQAAVLAAGVVEIGWNTDANDLSGHAALGFLPSWRVATPGTTFRWQPDNGSAVGLYRSPENLDRSEGTADIKAVEKFDGVVLTDNVPATPFFNVSIPPLEDIPGYDSGVHFRMSQRLNLVRLSNYGVSQRVGVKYDWVNDRFIWTERGTVSATQVLTRTDILQLNDTYVLPETVSSAAMAPTGTGYGLDLKDVGDVGYIELTLDVDFNMPGGGAGGQAQLISPQGAQITAGGGGQYTIGGVFSNPNLSPDPLQDLILQTALEANVEVGYLLQVLNGAGAGIYTVTAKALNVGVAEFTVSPAFTVADGPVSWRVFEAQLVSVFDPTVIADVKQVSFNHFASEPWVIQLLSSVGTVGGSLTAVVADARASGRATAIRFGLTQPPSANEASVSYLITGTELGTTTPAGLVVPSLTDPHFTNSSGTTTYFQIRIGSDVWPDGGSNILDVVSAFSGIIPAGTIEVLDSTGELRFNTDILSDYAGEQVVYDQVLLAASLLAAGTCEIDATDGTVQLSSADVTTYAGQTAYFVEQMITEGSLDVTISPINGSILFNKPLRENQIVETQSFQAGTDGTQEGSEIVAYLPLQVRLEEATRVDQFGYTFNPTGRTLQITGDEFIWVGVELQNFAGETTATINTDSSITFVSGVSAADTVKINYSVLEAFGGEQAFTNSVFPVFRMPFFLEDNIDTFTLETDRTADISVGQLMLLGPVPFYIENAAYSGATDVTTVTVWPSPQGEVGSRAPGKDAEFTLSDRAVAITIDPDGSATPGGGATGFLVSVDTTSSGTPFLPADKGQTEIVFQGNMLTYSQVGHLLEVGGYPYIIIGSSLSDDGRFTTVSLANPIYKGHDVAADAVRISVRPVYIPDPVEFVGIAPFVEVEGFSLFLMGATEAGVEVPGTELVEGVHYEVDPASGGVSFKKPTQPPLQPGEKLLAGYTALDPVSPQVVSGAILTPSYKAQYLFIATPSASNRIQGATLAAKYTYSAPDTFFFEVLPLVDYLGEVAGKALSNASSATSGGAPTAYAGLPDNSEQGSLGLRGQVSDLSDLDRAARAYIELYNGVCVSFEQVLEAMDGRIIGDRDGKFRFFLGHGKRYAPPGYEDQITGDLITRLVWREIVDEWSDIALMADGYYTEDDPVFDPVTAFEKDPANSPGETDGKTPNPDTLKFYTSLQRARVKNDMDDRLLVGFGRPRGLAALFPGLHIPGLFKGMWQPHRLSRLFPEQTKHFTRLFPGLEAVADASGAFTDPGFYSAGRKVTVDGPQPGETTEQTVKTRKSTIGVVVNPALGNIQNVVEVTAEDRLPRGRIWRYYPEGSAELDGALGTSTVGVATFVVTPLPLGEFPLDQTTGFPDTTQLLTNGGGLYDLGSGDVDLATPGFQQGQQLQFGTPAGPTGTTYSLSTSDGNGIFIANEPNKTTGATVPGFGCVITVMDVKGNLLAGGDVLVNGSTALDEIVSEGTGRGDTLLVGQSLMDLDNAPEDGDSPTVEQLEELAKSLPSYRIQFDLKVGKRVGEFIDASLPVKDDVFPLALQNIFGQKPPTPLSCIQGDVEFVNTDRAPVKLPALLGESKDDSGDVQIPYMVGSDTELSVLGDVAAQFQVLLGSDSTAAPYSPPGGGLTEVQDWDAIFPDEIILADGSILEAATIGPDRDPASLYTDRDLRPVETAGSYTAASAIGDIRRFDLLLVEVGQAIVPADLNVGMTGILTVGEVEGFDSLTDHSKVEPPRFISVALLGGAHKYTARNAYGYLSATFPATSGIQPSSSFGSPVWTTVLDFSSVGGLILSADTGVTAGGILALAGSGSADNCVVIEFFDPDPGATAGQAFLGAIIIPDTAVGGTMYVFDALTTTTTAFVINGTGITYSAHNIVHLNTSADPLASLPVVGSNFYDFAVTVDAYVDATTRTQSGSALTVGSGSGSTTCGISRDRLTFSERISFADALPRGSTPANGDANDLGAQVSFWETETDAVASSSINAPAEVNGGTAFTFLTRTGPSPDASVSAGVAYVGTFIGAVAGSEEGQIKAMAWEGHGNDPLPFPTATASGIKLSTVPSSDLNETGVILNGTGTMRDGVGSAGNTMEGTRNWIDAITAANGATANVVSGDIVVVDEGSASTGAIKTGTYLVRHVVEANTAAASGRPLLGGDFLSDAGSRKFLDLTFPKVKSLSGSTFIASGVPLLLNANQAGARCGFPDPAVVGANQYVYLINDNQYASYDSGTTTYTIQATSVYRAEYSAMTYDEATGEATFTLTGTYEDATGTAITAAEFSAQAKVGRSLSGIWYFPVAPQADTGFPANNLVGYDEDSAGNTLTAGFLAVAAGNLNADNHGGSGGVVVTGELWDKSATLTDIERLFTAATTPTAGSLGVRVPEGVDSTAFYTDRGRPIYGRHYATASGVETAVRGIPSHLSVEGLTTVQWENFHFDNTATIGVNVLECVLPFDRLTAGTTTDPSTALDGFFGISGIFLEASFARPTTDLALANPHVVSASNSLAGQPGQVGARNVNDFDPAATAVAEDVHFYVRRIRRFHEEQAQISNNLELLKYAYELRRGDYSSYVTGTRVFTAGTATYGTATNVGDFDNAKVNINSGDTLRILDATGNLLDQAEIQTVQSDTTMLLRKPGLTESLVGATTFEIYLDQPLVPQEQSNEQLLALVTDTVVFKRTVDYSASATDGGGASAFNTMQDTLVSDWDAEGVQEGDYVIIDPAGIMYQTDEAGIRPVGDQAVTGRSAFLAGEPASLDDNRGFYKVGTVTPGSGDLPVDGSSRFGGGSDDGTDDEIFGDSGSSSEYAALPTIGASTLTGGGEGQQALRTTAAAVSFVFGDRVGSAAVSSIQPFPYRIIRPSSIFSKDSLELVLFMRERMLSFIEEIRGIYANSKGGDYYIFQEEDHIEDIGSPTDPTDGAGLISNLVVTSLQGLVDETPYANVSDCLSVLGRRFWILDFRLDEDGYTDFADDGFSQRPVFPDLIDDVLNLDDRFRDLRYSWISFRADQVSGSIQNAKRAASQLPTELQKQKELIDQKKALDNS